ncbi:MAG: lipoate--protein ligase [Peptoniphilus sp.]|nr:lipoate--protein ligase [Peptoniphilus sp.]MDD7362626.1 lipoate--protein ligase [Bacillota bacterium]MDY6044975.1 lipoate--protein ligase [Peptoniphilus sp.]
MIYIESKSTDPAFNLALEEYVFDYKPAGEYFILWQNDNTIVIGKNQNTWSEIDFDFVKEHDITVVRRLSGGGAVYHDLGNLNFTFISPVDDLESLDFKRFCEPIAEAIRDLGADARVEGRNDILIDGKKISGNSQYIKDGKVMHHGTLLFNSDLTMIGEALITKDKYKSNAASASIFSRVTNIRDCLKEKKTMEQFKDSLVKHFKVDGTKEDVLKAEDFEIIEQIRRDRYANWDWNYGYSPEFEYTNRKIFPGCGEITVGIDVSDGKIKEMNFHGDFFAIKDWRELERRLSGSPFTREAVCEKIRGLNVEEYFYGLKEEDFLALLDI